MWSLQCTPSLAWHLDSLHFLGPPAPILPPWNHQPVCPLPGGRMPVTFVQAPAPPFIVPHLVLNYTHVQGVPACLVVSLSHAQICEGKNGHLLICHCPSCGWHSKVFNKYSPMSKQLKVPIKALLHSFQLLKEQAPRERGSICAARGPACPWPG